jgi:hypothetical protein
MSGILYLRRIRFVHGKHACHRLAFQPQGRVNGRLATLIKLTEKYFLSIGVLCAEAYGTSFDGSVN